MSAHDQNSHDQNPRISPRHRAVEGMGPRPSELIADRLAATAAFAKLTDARVEIEGAWVDAAALQTLATEQRRGEDELLAHWRSFREVYVGYLEAMRPRATTLSRVLEALDATLGDPKARGAKVRGALRICRLRRPPLAKVRALVAEAAGEAPRLITPLAAVSGRRLAR